MSDSTPNAGDPFVLQPEATTSPPSADEVEEAAEPSQPPMAWMLLRELVETVVLSVVIFLLIRMVVQNYRIESHSMMPNFQEGQFILVNKLAFVFGAPTRGEVIVFHNPRNTSEDYIKRVIALPGDTVEIRDQTVYIDGRPLPQPYATNPFPADYSFGPQLIPPDHLFVMGDNRPNSRDSRYPEVGAISEELIVGKAWLRVWPFAAAGFVPHYQLAPGVDATSVAPAVTPCCALP